MSYLSVLILVLVGIVVNHADALKTARVCEHTKGSVIRCPAHQVIFIQHAMYGRTRKNVCKPVNFPKGCVSKTSLIATRKRCHGKRACHLLAHNKIYGDPCKGVQKYLEVRYKCVAKKYKSYACEHTKGKVIACGAHHVINIVTAMYGRLKPNVCRKQKVPNKRCVARLSTTLTRNRCQGRRACRLLAHNGIYGDPCRGIVKYLTVVHTCRKSSVVRAVACEHTKGRVIGCPPLKVLSIRTAKYGRTTRTLCKLQKVPKKRCVARSSLTKTRSRCQGKRNCRLLASNKIYGDPCKNIVKYLDVRYSCVPKIFRAIACEHTKGRKIGCPGARKIRIVSALYGRVKRNVCKRVNPPKNGCASPLSLPRTRARCNGKKSCQLVASNKIYGDPCRGVPKYLYVRFSCV